MTSQNTDKMPDTHRGARMMSAAILISCLVAVVMVAHHPVATGGTMAEKVSSVEHLSGAAQLVHGAVMFVLALLTSGMLYFSALLGFRRPAVLTATIFYVVATALMFVATTIDGFVIPMIGAHCEATTVNCLQSTQEMLSLASIFVQSFTRIGEFATASAIFFWSIELLHFRSQLRVIGLAGVAIAVGHVVLLFGPASVLTPHSLLMLLALQVMWYLFAAVLMAGWFGLRLVPDESEATPIQS